MPPAEIETDVSQADLAPGCLFSRTGVGGTDLTFGLKLRTVERMWQNARQWLFGRF